MSVSEKQPPRLIFSGHDSFQCRQLWLKKGYDFLNKGFSFTREDAVLELGVGKNMVVAIRYWLKAFGLATADDKLTKLAHLIFDDADGFDPYLEDEATLWLLHFHLVKNGTASVYSLIFNELRREKIQFQESNFLNLVNRVAETRGANTMNTKTISSDWGVFVKMYGKSDSSAKDVDEVSSGLLIDLNLLQSWKTGRIETFAITNSERDELPAAVVLYAILIGCEFETSISFHQLLNEANSPGIVFALSAAGLQEKIVEITKQFEGITFNDQSGVKELQFRGKPEPIDVLRKYYGS
jgi:hypothetical protein